MTQFSAVIINYARPWNLPKIISSLNDFGVNDVLVWDQSPLPELSAERFISNGTVIVADTNVFTAGRYIAVQFADHDHILTVDDDYSVTKHGWECLADKYDGNRIAVQLPVAHGKYSQAIHGLTWTCFGYGSIIPRSLIDKFMVAHNEAYGHDALFHMKADRIFSSYVGEWDILKAMPDIHYTALKNPNGDMSETDENAIHLRDDHWPLTMEAMDRGLRLRSLRTSQTRDLSTYLTPSVN